MTPVFLFSLPRSGSTWTQRLLATHPEIATVAEPWILLPSLYSLKREGVAAEYNHRDLVRAVEDFCDHLPEGRGTYHRELRQFFLNLYANAAPASARYFLDKTPRYHLVISEIFELFPDAKFIFLWRDPLSVVASMITTWGRGKWSVYWNEIDLYQGLANLIEAYMVHKNHAVAVRYEDLLIDPGSQLARIWNYLGLDYDDNALADIKNLEKPQLIGRMGDKTEDNDGMKPSEQMAKWELILRNPVRKAWCRRYLSWIGPERLATMGYDLDILQRSLDEAPGELRHTASDLLRMLLGVAVHRFQTPLIRRSLLKSSTRDRSYGLL